MLAVFGAHRSVLLYLWTRHRASQARERPLPARLPRVTVQLPVYNEVYVVERLIEAVAGLRYPRDLLDVQVLDDSTDETSAVAAATVARLRRGGLDVVHLHRGDRTGYKAGALAAGLATARGELVAIFDADFVPAPDFLERALGHFEDPAVAVVQARWGHLNREVSLLTRAQAILLDAHFVLEHGARFRSGRFFNFNGTAGIWRRAAIEDAGGWQHDTLTEDLDLSYRAQLRGWRFVYRDDLVMDAELPVEVAAFKGQQARWAKGAAQTCRKLLGRILASAQPAGVKAEAAFHLTANLSYPLMVLLALLLPPALVIRHGAGLAQWLIVDLPFLAGATLSVCGFYTVAQRALGGPGWWRRLRDLPVVLALGIGLSVSNARAVLEGLLGLDSPFVRTAKYQVQSTADAWRHKRYRSPLCALVLAELLLAVYLAGSAVWAAAHGLWSTLPFILLFESGFAYVAGLSLAQAWPARRQRAPVSEPEPSR